MSLKLFMLHTQSVRMFYALQKLANNLKCYRSIISSPNVPLEIEKIENVDLEEVLEDNLLKIDKDP